MTSAETDQAEAARSTPRRRAPLYALYGANLISITGDVMMFLAVPWFVLQTTGSVAQTGITAFFSTGAVAAAALLGSAFVDRLGFQRASVVSDLASAAGVALIPLLFNIFGGEGAAITVLFSFPTRRRAILLGKNLAHVPVLLIVNFVGLTLAAALTPPWSAFPLALIWTLLAAPVLLAAGNLVSIRFPHRMLVRGQRWSRGGVAHAGGEGSGCAYGLLYLLAYGGAFAALLPALAAVLVPRIFGLSPLWYGLSLPSAFAYAITLYVILLGQSERWLLTREPEIAERILPPE